MENKHTKKTLPQPLFDFLHLDKALKSRNRTIIILTVYLIPLVFIAIMSATFFAQFLSGVLPLVTWIISVIFLAICLIPVLILCLRMRKFSEYARWAEQELGQTLRIRRRFDRNIIATETWLNQMHAAGNTLVAVDIKSAKFYFIKKETEPAFYRIGDKPAGSAVPEEYAAAGYETVCDLGRCFVLRTVRQTPDFSPTYDNHLMRAIKSKSFAQYWLTGYSVVWGIAMFVFITSLVLTVIDGAFELGGLIALLVIFAVLSLLLTAVIIRYISRSRAAKRLREACGSPSDVSWPAPDKNETDKLKKEKKYIRKLFPYWFLSPDLTEDRLEKMSADGLNLVKMGRLGGTFHFVKGVKKRIKYYIDHGDTDAAYYQMHKENGWELVYTSRPFLRSYSIWAREYAEEAPQLYTDAQSRLAFAAKNVRFYMGIVTVFLTLFVVMSVVSVMKGMLTEWRNYSYLFYTLCMVIAYIMPMLRSIRYYRRTKKRCRSTAH